MLEILIVMYSFFEDRTEFQHALTSLNTAVLVLISPIVGDKISHSCELCFIWL